MIEEELWWMGKCGKLKGDVKGIIKRYFFPWL
jgi:hypothetical protein